MTLIPDERAAALALKRRQNLSCEQCRGSKKACDGFHLNAMVQVQSTPDNLKSSPDLSSKPLPCSYCDRTKKQCSLHHRWSEARFLLQVGTSPQPSSDSPRASDRSPHNPKRKLEQNEHIAEHAPVGQAPEAALEPTLHESPCPTSPRATSTPTPATSTPVARALHTDGSSLSIANVLNPAPIQQRNWLDFLDLQRVPVARESIGHGPLSCATAQEQVPSDKMGAASEENIQQGPSPSDISDSFAQPPLAKRARYTPGAFASQTALSEFDLQTTMMQISNKRLIMESLLKIYHDVLESNLACWLTERTCPYTKSSPMTVLVDGHVSTQGSAALSPQSTLSSSSTNTLTLNRFYSRILRLDRAMAANNLVSLTPSQDRAASRALSQVIMAFSTQWSQNSTRKERFFGGDSTPSNIEDDFFENHNETFEKDFQHATWHQAKAALLEASEIESYRVVYAEILFNWAEKPEGSRDVDLTCSWAGKNGLDDDDALFCSFSDMVGRGGPPVFVESASRKIQVLKFRLDAANMGLLKTTGARGKNSKPRNSSSPIIGPEEQATARLLYWLVVMCDTVSSSTNERPLAIKEECYTSMTSRERRDTANDASFDGIQSDALREMECFETDKPLQLDWPTAQDDAFEVIAKSVPVKVLLFRKVSSLQNALRQGNHVQTDDIIQSSIKTYRRWNVTYGAFFRKLAQMYTTLPARIKGWFICVVIPWHLAVMLMADLIDFADKNEIGQSDGRAARFEAQITSRMRRSTAIEVAELAKLTCPLSEDWGGTTSTEQLPGYHYAVKSSAILTEPWTVLLIGAFRNAAVYHLGIVEDLRRNDWQALGHYPNEMREAEGRVKHCIDALWLLGRRSHMSYDLARLLSERLVAR